VNIEELELLRKKAVKRIIYSIIISLIFILIIIYKTKYYFLIPIGLIISIIITIIISNKLINKFNLGYKGVFVEKSLQKIFDELTYEPEKGLNKNIIASTEMMDMGDRYSSNDYVKGKYKNINIEQADVHIEEERETRDKDGNRHTYWVTIFRGKWMIFDFNKKFKADIQLCQKGFHNSRINNWFKEDKFKKVQMEDEMFNNLFRIYAQNEHDAFYIITPSLMEKIKILVNNINGKLLFCFIDNKLHIGLENGKDSFEPSIFKKINEEVILEEISKDIKLITSFVDELDLDNDLFRKEV